MTSFKTPSLVLSPSLDIENAPASSVTHRLRNITMGVSKEDLAAGAIRGVLAAMARGDDVDLGGIHAS